VLELAAAFVTYRMRTGEQTRDQAAGLAWRLLAARSTIPVAATTPPVPEPAVRPDQGHDSARVALGVGMRDGRFFQSLRVRPAYHTLSDPAGGYVPGAEIDFLDLGLRHYTGDSAPILDSLTVVGIRSIAPRDELFKPISWELGGGLDRFRRHGNDEEGALVGTLWAGAGPALALDGDGLVSLMAEADLFAGPDCPETCNAALGPAFTLIWPVTERWAVQLNGRLQALLGDEITDRFAAGLGQTLELASNLALKLDLAVEKDRGGPQSEWSTSLHWYF
jgi:hypothetical protein